MEFFLVPTPMPKEPPTLPDGKVTLYLLSGERDRAGYSRGAMSPETVGLPELRNVPILATTILTDDLAASLRETMRSPHTYAEEGDRCFIPRHGLRFGDVAGVDFLICLQCHRALLCLEDEEVWYPLTPASVEKMGAEFRSAELALKAAGVDEPARSLLRLFRSRSGIWL